MIELGLDTFGDVTSDAAGRKLTHAEVIRDVIEEGVLADAAGADFFGVGEHHREVCDLGPGGGARRHRRADGAHPPRIRREDGSLYVGSPETVARKIAATAGALGLSRFDLKYSAGPLHHDRMMRCIELYGRAVMPRVRELTESSNVR